VHTSHVDVCIRQLNSKENVTLSVLNYLSTTPWRCMGEWIYRSTFSWIWHYFEVSSQLHAQAALPPGGGKPRYPLNRRLGTPQNRGRDGERKISPLPGFELRPLFRPGRSHSLYRMRYSRASIMEVTGSNLGWCAYTFHNPRCFPE
jgi:hypothetical protein